MTIGEPVCVAPAGDRCGEGPVWHPEEQALYWTDINRFLIHRLNPGYGCVKSWFFDEPVTALALTGREDTLAVALGSRVLLWKPRPDERRDHGFRLNGWPAVRLNDGPIPAALSGSDRCATTWEQTDRRANAEAPTASFSGWIRMAR